MGFCSQRHRDDHLRDYYSYDLLGQRITHSNTLLAGAEITDYDLQGCVTRHSTFGGDTATFAYAWVTDVATSGMRNFNGWRKTTGNSAGLSAWEVQDVFGRTIDRVDFGDLSPTAAKPPRNGNKCGMMGMSSQNRCYAERASMRTMSQPIRALEPSGDLFGGNAWQ